MRILLASLAAAVLAGQTLAASSGSFVYVNDGTGMFNYMAAYNSETISPLAGAGVTMSSSKITTGASTSVSTTSTTFSIGHYPCLHIGATHSTSSVTGINTGTGSVNGNINYTSNSQYFILSHAYLYNETNGVSGVQKGETVGKAVGLCTPFYGYGTSTSALTWDPFTLSNFSQGNTFVYLFQKCVQINNSTWGAFGKMCFNFSVGNGSYTFNGVQRMPGEMKIDQIYYPSANVQQTKYYYGLGGTYYTSSDSLSGSVNFNANTAATQGSGSFSFQPNVLVNYNTGAAAYLNWATSVNVNTNGVTSSANVNVQTLNTTQFQDTFNFTTDAATYAGSNVNTQSIILFDFLTPVTNVQSITWDPSTGYASSTSTTGNGSSAAGVSVLIAAFSIAFMLVKRLM
jgi:hypothetical protein